MVSGVVHSGHKGGMKMSEPYDVVIYGSGLVACSVCAPAEMDPLKVEERVNQIHPTGIVSPWSVSSDEHFNSGQPNPCECEKESGRLHYLMEC